MDRPCCAVCAGELPTECWSCGGSGVVNGELPTGAGWYHAKCGDEVVLLEVDGDLGVIGLGSGGRSSDPTVSQANWHDRRDSPVSEWGPKVELVWGLEVS